VYDREDALVARLHQLGPALHGEPDPDFRAATRARLVAMAAVRTPEPAPVSGLQRLLAGRAPDVARARWRSRFTAGLAGAALTVTALAGLVAVADSARPGDVLYDLKRGTERTQLALAGDHRGQTLLDFASTRLEEIEDLVGADPALVLETLQTMDAQTAEGAVWLTERAVETGEEQPLDQLSRWADGQAGELAALQPLVPGEATQAVGVSLALLGEIGARTDGLAEALACPAGPAVAGSDDLGPVPAACPAPETPSAPGTGTDPTAPGQQTGSGPSAPAPGGTAPGGTTPGLPTVPSDTAPGGGDSGARGAAPPAAPTPTTPRLPTPTLPLPTLSVPTKPPAPSSAILDVPPVGSIQVCAPPLLTVGC
jgi:hypothetical protein